MGARMSAVADAGPLIHLAEIDSLVFLSLFNPLCIPASVWRETVEQGRVSRDDILRLLSVERHELNESQIVEFVDHHHLESLHLGEQECLYLCRHINVPLLLTDDLAVRDVAKMMQLTPVGSLGVVVRAFRAGLVSYQDARDRLFSLHQTSSLFVTRTIVELAVMQLEQKTVR